MRTPSLLRASMALALCLFLALPACPQTGGNIGPSNGEIIAIIVGIAAAITGVGILIYHETHKHPSITGCIASGAEGLTLKSEKDQKVYALAGDSAALKPGEQVALKGKKTKEASGKPVFQVEKLAKDYGACHP